MVTVWWYAASLIHYSFLNSGKIITSERYAQQINEMHGKPQHLQLAFVNRKGPVLLNNTQLHVTQPMLQKLNELGYEALPHPPYSPDFSSTDCHVLQASQHLFAGKMLPQPGGGRKCFPRVSRIPRHIFLCYGNKQTFLVGKNLLIVTIPIFINKDVFWA